MRRGDNNLKVVSILPIAIYFEKVLPCLPIFYHKHCGGIEPHGVVGVLFYPKLAITSIPFLAIDFKEKLAKAICIPSINTWSLDLKEFLIRRNPCKKPLPTNKRLLSPKSILTKSLTS
jgi:hypothetical protein